MREIKFRAWIFAGFDKEINPYMTEVRSIKRDFDQWIIEEWNFDNWYNASEYYLMQYTGFNKVYQSDIIKAWGWNFIVVWNKHQLTWWLHSTNKSVAGRPLTDLINYKYKIIGNIYENPELLNKGV